MIRTPLPQGLDPNLYQILLYILQKSVDGTVPPFFVDTTNQRILIGATAASASNQGKMEITGDFKIIGTANGIILPDAGGTTHLCRMRVQYDSASGNFFPIFDTIS